jgi:hypothetical protein
MQSGFIACVAVDLKIAPSGLRHQRRLRFQDQLSRAIPLHGEKRCRAYHGGGFAVRVSDLRRQPQSIRQKLEKA